MGHEADPSGVIFPDDEDLFEHLTLPIVAAPTQPMRQDGAGRLVPVTEKHPHWIVVRTTDHFCFSLGSSQSLWSEGHEQALRFARPEDAEAFARVYLAPGFMLKVHEID